MANSHEVPGVDISPDEEQERGAQQPFARVGIFDAAEGSLASLVAFFRDEVTPSYATCEGFLGYQALVDTSAGRYIGLSYWNSRRALEASDAMGLRSREGAAHLGATIVGDAMFVEQVFFHQANHADSEVSKK